MLQIPCFFEKLKNKKEDLATLGPHSTRRSWLELSSGPAPGARDHLCPPPLPHPVPCGLPALAVLR